ncbi:MAG TPA: hypothetical protein VNZ86_03780, partial [Bacteroidia bacterium]|nr:hypothetical protein [Bacteroidia bacterium]
MPKFTAIFLILTFRILFLTASPIDIGLFTDSKPLDLMISITSGKYLLKGDGRIMSDTLCASILEFRRQNDSIWVKTLERS